MMKPILFSGLLLSAAMISGCSSDATEQNAVPAAEPTSTALTAEQAADNLRTVLDATRSTRSSLPTFDAADIQVFTDGAATRSGEEQALAYIVNFDEGGYAILGADSRQAPVLALMNSGRMAPEMLLEARQAVDDGRKTDAVTMIRASMAGYLRAKVSDSPAQASPAGFQPIIVQEFRDSLLSTSWSPADELLKNCSRTKIALAQIMVYNANAEGYYPTMIYGYVLRWCDIAPIMNYKHLDNPDLVARLAFETMLMSPLQKFIADNSPYSVLSDIHSMFQYANAYKQAIPMAIDTEKVREMIYLNANPTIACFDKSPVQDEGWVMDGWMKMQQGGITYNLVHCKFGKDQRGTDDGFLELSALDGPGVRFTQHMLYYTI